MEEINSDYAIQAIENLKRIVDECLGEEKEQLKIFTIDQIENLIDETVNTFLDKYESLLKEYM